MDVLIVDDDEINVMIIGEMLEEYLKEIDRYDECSVDAAYNGKEAVEMFKQKKLENQKGYGLIFMDIDMPEMNGFEATRKIRLSCDEEEPTIIMVSARDNPKDISEGFLNGCDWYIKKPYEIEQLEVLVNDHFANRIYLHSAKECCQRDDVISAKEFMQNFLYEFSVRKVEVLDEKIEEIIGRFYMNKDEKLLEELADYFLELSEFIKNAGRFNKLVFAMIEVSEILRDLKEDYDFELLVDFLFNLMKDLNKWIDSIFISQYAINIHYLDDSLISSIIQIESILKNQDIFEDEIDFF